MRFPALVLAACLVTPGVAAADDSDASARNPIPKHRLWYSDAIFGRINPLGLINQFAIGYRVRLMESDSVLFNDTYFTVGVNTRVSPAFVRAGPMIRFSPIAVWNMWASYEFAQFFGTFDQVTSFASPDEDYSQKTLKDLDAGVAHRGGVLNVGTVVQAKVGPIAIRNTLEIVRFDLNLPDGEQFLYDGYWDRMVSDGGIVLLNELDVIAFVKKTRVGARWSFNDSYVGDNDSVGAQSNHRIGPLFAYQFHDRGPGARFDKPTLFALAQWWVKHPYRTGQQQPQGLPLIAIGFAFQGDLLGPKPPGR